MDVTRLVIGPPGLRISISRVRGLRVPQYVRQDREYCFEMIGL